MRPPVRLLKPLEAPSLRNSKSVLYVCSNCRYDASALTSHHNHQFRHASGNTPFTEKLRRRIWGTDNPPGLEDPYGGEGVIASKWAKRKAQYLGEEEPEVLQKGEQEGQAPLPAGQEEHEIEDVDSLIPADFKPAATAHELPRIGHLSQWSDFPPTEGDIYQPFISLEKAQQPAQFRTAAHSVAVELSLLQELKKPLSLACDVPRHDETIWTMIKQCNVKDNSLQFPNKQTKETLLFVFNQLGQIPEAQTEAAVEATEQVEPEATAETTEEIEGEITHEEELQADEAVSAVEVEEPKGIVDAVYSYALKAKTPPKRLEYLGFSLADPEVKFAFFKRYSQITGHHMQDICAYKAKTVGDVIEHVEKIYCRSKKLSGELLEIKTKLKIPNLTIYSKRYTKGVEDRETGRSKLVEAALRERGLLIKEERAKSSKFTL